MTDFIRRSHWTFADIIALYVTICATAFLALWLAPGTSAFLQPGEITYARQADGQIMASWTRGTPRGGVWLSWDTECRSAVSRVDRGINGDGSDYQQTNHVVSYPVAPEVVACFDDGLPVSFSHTWQQHFLGIFPRRPLTKTYTIFELPNLGE